MHTSKNGGDTSASGDAKGGAAAAAEVKKEGKESTELDKYWQVVRTNPADFTGWTYLLQFVEQEVRGALGCCRASGHRGALTFYCSACSCDDASCFALTWLAVCILWIDRRTGNCMSELWTILKLRV